MNHILRKYFVLTLGGVLLTACGSDPESDSSSQAIQAPVDSAVSQATTAAPIPECEAGDGDDPVTYICGPSNAEDLLNLGDTGMILVSGMSGDNTPGHLYLVNPLDHSFDELIFSSNFSMAMDSTAYPSCPGPLNLESFSVHGLSLNEYAQNQFDLYTTSHGEREAIEIYDLDLSSGEAILTWKGCVVLPENTFSNSVAILSDGGFVTTKMMDPTEGFGSLAGGGITGNVFEWHPGGDVFAVEGTELSGANGIAMSADDRYMYVAALGSSELIKFDRSQSPIGKEVISVDIVPDNIRWGEEGKLLTAGGNTEANTGWSVLEVDADTFTVIRVGGADQNSSIQGVSSALQVGNNLWVGTFNGDRIGYIPKQ